jgi:hypothetical protein
MNMTFRLGRCVGIPQTAGSVELTPESFVLLVRFGPWGYVWNWPTAVTLAWPPDQQDPGSPPLVQRHPIRDVTRIALWMLGALSVLVILAALLRPARSRAGKSSS